MPIARRSLILISVTLLAASLGGCGSISSFLAGSIGDYIPSWAGGLPADAPPRPGAPEYGEWVKLHEPSAGPAVTAQPVESGEFANIGHCDPLNTRAQPD